MHLSHKIGHEFVLSFVSGGLPILFAYWWGGSNLIIQAAKSMLPEGRYYVVYLTCISVLAAAVMYAAKLTKRQPPSCISNLLHEIVGSLQPIFRLVAGFLLTYCVIWWVYDRSSINAKFVYFAILGILSFTYTVFYRPIVAWLESR